MKKSTLAAGLKAAAGQKPHVVEAPATVLIGGHFSPEVRRALLIVQAEQKNTGKNLKQLLGEAINDLCAKYGKPEPYNGEERR
jgi:hypothetical protein